MRGEFSFVDLLAEAYGPDFVWIIEWAARAFVWAWAISGTLFLGGCLISWPVIIGARMGFWRLPKAFGGEQ